MELILSQTFPDHIKIIGLSIFYLYQTCWTHFLEMFSIRCFFFQIMIVSVSSRNCQSTELTSEGQEGLALFNQCLEKMVSISDILINPLRFLMIINSSHLICIISVLLHVIKAWGLKHALEYCQDWGSFLAWGTLVLLELAHDIMHFNKKIIVILLSHIILFKGTSKIIVLLLSNIISG